MRGITQSFIDGVPLAALANLSLVNQSLVIAVDDAPEAGEFGIAGDVNATFASGVLCSHALIAEIQRFVHAGVRVGHWRISCAVRFARQSHGNTGVLASTKILGSRLKLTLDGSDNARHARLTGHYLLNREKQPELEKAVLNQ
jgi:hypothetical protein